MIEARDEGRLGPTGAARLDSLQRLLETFAEKGRTVESKGDR